MITIALIDDHLILRKSLAVLIGLIPGFEVILQAENGQDLINHLKRSALPDIVLTDIAMPLMDGVEITRWLQKNHPAVKVIGLSMLSNEAIVIRMLKNGAKSYLLKDTDPDELAAAIRKVYATGYYHNKWLDPYIHIIHGKDPQPILNEKELMFLRWTCTEKSHKEIAAEMYVSPRTIDGYRDSVFRKLNVCSRVGMVIYALKNEIVIL